MTHWMSQQLPLSPALRRVLLAAALTVALAIGAVPGVTAPIGAAGGSSLRFYGTGPADIDRVTIPLGMDGRAYPVNVGGDLTIELWMKAEAAPNAAPACGSGPDGWYYGNVVIDRDVFGDGDYGDYGIALRGGRLVVGVNNGGPTELNLCGTVPVTDGQWHHVAVTRNAASGTVRIFVDGTLDASATGPTGRIDYRAGRSVPDEWPNDPFLVFAAEKHDYPGSLYYTGLLDDVRISNIARYGAGFARPGAPHAADANTVALYHFDEGSGTAIGDSSGASGGPSKGTLRPRSGGAAQHWSTDIPFGGTEPSPSPGPSPSTSPNPAPPPGGCQSATGAIAAAALGGTPEPGSRLSAGGMFLLYLPVLCR